MTARPENVTIQTAIDPRQLILDSPMSLPQVLAVALTGALSVLDGFDILSIAFVAPVLARELHLGSSGLGLLLSSGLLGTLIGSLALAALADVIGRRPVVLISLAMMVSGMLISALCQSFVQLAVARVFTGVGIGAMAVVLNPIAVELSNRRSRSLAIAMMSIGYPIGGIVGGAVAAFLLPIYDWRAVFLFGAAIGLLLLPLVIGCLPESLLFLLERRSESSLLRVNALLERFGHGRLPDLPPLIVQRKTPYREIFRGPQLGVTVRVSAISFLTYLTIYFFLSWQPKILVDLGFGASTAASIAGASSFAGACGCLLFGVLSRFVQGRILAVISILGLGIWVIAFGVVPAAPVALITIALLAGTFVATATVGLFVTAADAFEPHMRATGTGFIVGIGRIGSALAPSLAGLLFSLGGGRPGVATGIGMCAIIAGGALIWLPRHSKTS
jgi:MFS family permease